MARSLRLSNRKLRTATNWAPLLPSVREGWPATLAQMKGIADSHCRIVPVLFDRHGKGAAAEPLLDGSDGRVPEIRFDAGPRSGNAFSSPA